jgi:hypothetical protein
VLRSKKNTTILNVIIIIIRQFSSDNKVKTLLVENKSAKERKIPEIKSTE